MKFEMFTDQKRKLFKILLVAAGLYMVQWTRVWFDKIFSYDLFGGITVATIIGALLFVTLYWYKENEI